MDSNTSTKQAPAIGIMPQELEIADPVLDSMLPVFKKAAKRLESLASKGCFFHIRYHNDGDGICSALCMQQALESAGGQVFSKPSIGATYLDSDAIEDSRLLASKSPAAALFLDFATNGESVSAISGLKQSAPNADIFSIDHHPPSPGLGAHCSMAINQHSVGADVNYSAGILCSRIASLMPGSSGSRDFFKFLGALSLACDKSTLAPKSEGFERLAFALDFSATTQRARFGLQSALRLVSDAEEFATAWAFAQERFSEIEPYYEFAVSMRKVKSIEFYSMNLDYLRKKARSLPPSRIVDFFFSRKIAQSPQTPIAVAGVSDRLVTFRANSPAVRLGFRADRGVEEIKNSIPQGFVGGGGHASAASARIGAGFGQSAGELAIKAAFALVE
ncbi:MAG: hypothetical protein WC506_03925 [Candidatus Micrarchaeia archaeon]